MTSEMIEEFLCRAGCDVLAPEHQFYAEKITGDTVLQYIYELKEQVRKETAKELLGELFSAREFEPLYDNDKGGYVRLKEVKALAQKCGVGEDIQ